MILVVAARAQAAITGPENRYVCVPLEGRLVVVRDACKHRGGPLSLGKLCEKTGTIACPWHDIVNGPRDFARNVLPSVRVGDEIRFVAPDTPPKS